ncbi:MAG: class I SAM-dependent methyltransferase, partial [Cellulosilyticum sp.]|nr:class I SAM-dependent methyltransferase [Cellulosilyticum sp.]
MIAEQESITAKLCAFTRAWHSNKSKHKVFDDYLAYDLMGKDEYENIQQYIQEAILKQLFGDYEDEIKNVEEVIKEYIAPIVLSRIYFTESLLTTFAEENGPIQYVICGAGYDTFSWRNTNEDITIFEIDHPDTQRYKMKKIEELEWNIPNNVHFVSVDFEKEIMVSKLYEAGFNPHQKTFFSILGVSYYLTLPVFTATLKQIAELSQKGSVLAFDYPIKDLGDSVRVKKLEALTALHGEVMQ